MKIRMLTTACLVLILAYASVVKPQQLQLKIGLVHSETSLMNDKSHNQAASIAWEYFLLNNKIKYDVFYDDELASDDLSDFDLIILPETNSLSDDAFNNLSEYIQNDGSVWMLGNIGEYDQKNEARTKSFSEFILGTNIINLTLTGRFSAKLSFTSETLITPPELMQSDFLVSFQRATFAAAANQRSSILAYYNFASNFKGENITTGIIASTYGRGRVLWFGFQLDQLIGKADQTKFNSLYYSAIDWLQNKPSVQLNYLPGTLSAFKVFSAIINDVQSLNSIPDEIKNSDGRLNLFIRPENFSSLMQSLGLDSRKYSFNFLVSSAELSTEKFYKQLLERLNLIEQLKKENNQKNIGLFITGDFQRENLELLEQIHSAGITFIFANDNFFIFDSENNLKLFPAYKLISNIDVNFQTHIPLELGSERIYNYLLTDDLHTKADGDIQNKSQIGLNDQLLQISVKTIDEIIQYYYTIENVDVDISKIESDLFELTIINSGITDVEDLSLKLLLPEGMTELKIKDEIKNIALLKMKYENQFYIKIDSVRSRQTLKLTFSYEASPD